MKNEANLVDKKCGLTYYIAFSTPILISVWPDGLCVEISGPFIHFHSFFRDIRLKSKFRKMFFRSFGVVFLFCFSCLGASRFFGINHS